MKRSEPILRPEALVAAFVGVISISLVVLVPSVRFAHRNPQLHLVLETTEALIALLTGYLVFGRFRRDQQIADLLLVYALMLFGLTNLLLSVGPDLSGSADLDTFSTWAPVTTRFVAAMAFVGAAFLPRGKVAVETRAQQALIWALVVTFAAVAIAVRLLDDVLPPGVETEVAAEESGRPTITGHPVVIIVQVVLMVAYAAAAWGYLRRYERTRDDFMLWLGTAAMVSAFARIHYALFPSLYSQFVYTGDFLRLGFYLVLLYGAAREIRSYWRSMAHAALSEERRRLASELHDGIAQELTFMSGHMSRMGRAWGRTDPEGFGQLRNSADRAIAEARRAISVLRGSADQSLDRALHEVAVQSVPGEHPRLDLDLQHDVVVSPQTREALVRVVREALINARRHADASVISLQLIGGNGFVKIRVSDDGVGFDVASSAENASGFGLITMKERMRGMKGSLTVDSETGRGTTIEVRIP